MMTIARALAAHPCAGRDPSKDASRTKRDKYAGWIPAFAGMTGLISTGTIK